MYFDTHCHLNSEQLYENRDEFIKHALDNQVEMMVVVGYDLESSKKAVEIAKEHSFIYAAVGIGPNDCLNTTTQDLQIIDEYLNEPKVVALGEIGLDYYWDDVPSDKQKEIFQQQVDFAKKHQKPIIIHCRDAYEDTYEVLKRNGHPGIMHCYSGSVEMAKRFIDDNNISLHSPLVLCDRDGKTILYGTGTTADGWFIKLWVVAKYPKIVFSTYQSERKSKEVKVCDSIIDSFEFVF